VELWDVEGSSAPGHRAARRAFLQNADGLILVHDLTNKKSAQALSVHWLKEFRDANAFSANPSATGKLLVGAHLNTLLIVKV